MGDASDNIPGVPKIGEKTATELMTTYGSIDGIYEHLEEIKKNAIRESLRENKELLDLCLRHPESIGAAFTYNEPLIAWEYYRDCAKLLKEHGLKTVLVTNGCVNIPILEEIMPYTDAMNIDLKGDREFYKELRGDYDTVREAIAYCSRHAHVEVTALIVPGKNDSEELMREHAQWLASLDPDMYLHITRYFPRYKYRIPPADKEVLYRLKDTAGAYLRHVYLGNVW